MAFFNKSVVKITHEEKKYLWAVIFMSRGGPLASKKEGKIALNNSVLYRH